MTELFRVVHPGILTTVQDIGRPQAVAAGVQPGGAMDRFAHVAANLLVDNDRSLATLECTLTGPRLVAEHACVIAISGADFGPTINGDAAPMWTSVQMTPGDELGFGPRRSGARAYIAVAGGVLGDRWLGSLSTNLMCARGGMHGRALVAGDMIAAGETWAMPATGRMLGDEHRPTYDDHTLRAIRGPHFTRLTAESQRALWDEAFTVNPNSNRMGYRLDGARLQAPGEELLSFSLVAGVIQLPAGGQPILLMADHQTAGGYPVIATVCSASMPIAAQLAPGDELRLVETSIEDALRARAAQRAALDSLTS